MFDYIIKGGRIIDPSQDLDEKMDLAINDGKIALIDKKIEENNAKEVIKVNGKLVTPGLIDLHSHVYWGGTSISINPNEIGPKSGITTFVDAGSSGPGNFLGFNEHIIKSCICNVFAFINLSYAGMAYFSRGDRDNINANMYGEYESLKMISTQAVLDEIQKFSDIIKGIKVRLAIDTSGSYELMPLRLALKVAELSNKPVMVHIGEPPPNIEQVLPLLRKGDIITHSFKGGINKPLDREGCVLPEILNARERGILIDIGHGSGSFSFETAKKMIGVNFFPDTIGSDLHVLSIKGPVFDLPTTMSKFINIGMPLSKVILACTHTPATIICEEKKIGQLKIGCVADISVFELEEGKFEFYDAYENKLIGDVKLFPKMTFKNGKLIYEDGKLLK